MSSKYDKIRFFFLYLSSRGVQKLGKGVVIGDCNPCQTQYPNKEGTHLPREELCQLNACYI